MTTAFANAENLLHNILEATPDLVLIYCLETNATLYVNKNLTKLLGYSIKEVKNLRGRFLHNIIHEEDLPTVFASFQKLHHLQDDEIYKLTLRIKKADGQTGWFKCRFKVFKRDKEAVNEIICIFTDVTDEVSTQQKLLEEEIRFKAIYNNTSDFNFFVDKHLRIITINKTAEKLLLKTIGKTLAKGDELLSIIPDDMRHSIQTKINEALEGLPTQLLQSYRNEQGYTSWFRTKYYPIYNLDGSDIIGVNINSRDVSELMNANIILEKQNSSLRSIAQMNAHEVRRPLSNILGLMHLIELQQENNELNTCSDVLEKLKHSAKELDEVIKRMVLTAANGGTGS